MSETAAASPHGGRAPYFRHEVMRYFAQSVLGRRYEELAHPDRPYFASFCFDPDARCVYRPSDPLTPLALRDFPGRLSEVRPVAAALLRRRSRCADALFRIPGLLPCGMVVHARDMATVVVQRRPRAVWKLVADASYLGVLEAEREGARLFPALAPAVLGWTAPAAGTPGYVQIEYALDTEPLSSADLPAVLRHITPALMEGYRASGVTRVTAAGMDAEIRQAEREIALGPPTAATRAGLETLARLRALLAWQAAARDPLLARAFAHGDVQLSNIRRNGTRIAVIDWANGGRYNVLFDAFVVELFYPTPGVWRDALVKGAVDPERGFQGWLPSYLAALAAGSGIRLSPPDVAAGLVCCMAEKTVAIVRRFAGRDDARGVRSLGRVRRLLSEAGQEPS